MTITTTGKSTGLLDAIKVPSSPFPGLRPFEFKESHLFFGRDEQIEKMMAKLAGPRFLAVVGTSGSGKSSLVRAGLMPALRSGMMTEAGSNWRIAVMRPSNDPIGNLARALNSPDVFGSDEAENAAIQIAVAEATLRLGSRGLVEVARQNVMPDSENLLVVVDQFEELFRFAREAHKANDERFDNDAAAFVKLLLESVKPNESGQRPSDTEANIYVVLTMRSDFLGDCSQFWDLPEAINESQYLIPRLTRDQLREVIEGPVAVGGGQITPRLVNQLLNDITDNQDQLPILQHALMRTWDEWKHPQHEHQSSPGAIDLCCYEATGGMAEALSRHADEAYNELDETHQKIAEKMFKALTEKGEDNREIRRPVTLGELCAVTGATAAEVIAVIKTFRAPGRSFLMPPAEVPLNSESLIDISHESLIRNWQRLSDWVGEEAASSREYLRLVDTATRYREGRESLLRDSGLQTALDWRDRQLPNQEWAQRYHPEFAPTMSFLDESRAAREADVKRYEQLMLEAEEKRNRELRKAWIIAAVLLAAFMFSLASAVYAWRQRAKALEFAEVATKQTEIAKVATKEAEKKREDAEASAKEATKQTEIAKAATMKSEKKTEEAKAANVSLNEKVIALEIAEREAARQRGIAENNLKDANQERRKAENLSTSLETANMSLRDQIEVAKKAREDEETQRQRAEKSLGEAVQQRNLAVARQLRNVAESEWNVTGDGLVRSSLLAVESLKSDWTPEGYEALSRGLNLLPRPPSEVWKTPDDQPALAVIFSHNGRWLATRSIDDVRIWDVASRSMLYRLEAPRGQLSSMSFSPDDRLLVAGCGDIARVWETTTWKKIRDLPNGNEMWSVAFSSDSSLLATASYASEVVRVYQTTTWDEIAQIKANERDYVKSVAFIPKSRWLVTTGETTKAWEITQPQQPLAEIQLGFINTDFPSTILSPNGRWLAIGGRLCEVITGDNKTVQFKAVAEKRGPLGSDNNHGLPVTFSPDGRFLVTASDDGTMHIWEVATGREESRLAIDMINTSHAIRKVGGATFSPDGRWLMTGQLDGTISKWMIDGKESIRLPHGDKVQVKAVAYSPDGQWLVTGSSDHIARVFQTNDWHEVVRMEHETEVSTVAFSPDGQWLMTLDGNTMQVFETGSWRKVVTKKHEDEIATVAFSQDGRRLFTVSRQYTVRLFVFEAATWRESPPMKHEGAMTSYAFSPDGKWLATKTEHYSQRSDLIRPTKTRVWDITTGDEVAWMSHKDEDSRRGLYQRENTTGQAQATSGGRKELALEAASWQQAVKVTKDKSFRFAIESSDKQWKASKDRGEVLLKGVKTTGKGINIPHENVNDLDFSPNVHWLATAGEDGMVRLWPLSKDGLVGEACARLPRNLNEEEWKKYMGDIPYRKTCPGLPVP